MNNDEFDEILNETLRKFILAFLDKFEVETKHPIYKTQNMIYHYTTISGLRGMLTSHSIWTSPKGYLNDRNEFMHGRDLFQSQIKSALLNPIETNVNLWNDVSENLNSIDPNRYFVSSFIFQKDQLSQWRGYASDGSGYSIGFESVKFLSCSNSPLVMNAIYDKDLQQKFCNLFCCESENILSNIMHDKQSSIDPITRSRLISSAIFLMLPGFKHPGFSEEQEVRIYVILGKIMSNAKSQFVFSERGGLTIPHIPLTWEGDKLPIQEIIVGPNLDFEKAKWSLEHLLEQNGYSGIEIKKSAIPYISS